MSRKLIAHSPDLQRLRSEGYFITIRGGFLVMREVPYVNAQRQVRRGTLISSLTLAADVTQKPDTHVVHFDGDEPCDAAGEPLRRIINDSRHFDFGEGLTARHSFSSKPQGGYADYYQKMSTYASILCGPATTIEPGATPRTFSVPDEDDNSVFCYTETASDRVGIGAVTERLAPEKLAIIGLGGSGSYVLDFVAKTPAQEIHLFDADEFLQHNAFRAPGAPSIEELRDAPKKVHYFHGIYSRMRRGIVAHPVALTADNLHLLDGVTFAFICIDGGKAKLQIIRKLEELDVPFIDVGIGIELTDGSLGGILRTTTSTSGMREHVHDGRISFGGSADEEDLYSSNIQVADLNAFNALMAVIKWKKIRGFYRDLEEEHHSSFTIDGNQLINSVLPTCSTAT